MSIERIQEISALLTVTGLILAGLALTYFRHHGLKHFRQSWEWSRKLYFEIVIVAKLRRMNTNETIMLKDFILEQRSFNKTILDEVHLVKRGLYGDEKNGVKGLIERQNEDDVRIEALETEVHKLKGFRKQIVWTGAGFIAGLQALWEWIKWKSK